MNIFEFFVHHCIRYDVMNLFEPTSLLHLRPVNVKPMCSFFFFRQLVRKELNDWDSNKVWPFSCLAAQKEQKCLTGMFISTCLLFSAENWAFQKVKQWCFCIWYAYIALHFWTKFFSSKNETIYPIFKFLYIFFS